MTANSKRCPHCNDSGWRCESHPHLPMHHAGCTGAGELCGCPIGRALELQLDQHRATGGAFGDGYVPQAQRLEPVTLGEPLWTVTKDAHSATAEVRAVHGIGLELRFSIDGQLYHSQVFRDWPSLEAAAREEARRFRGARLVAGLSDECSHNSFLDYSHRSHMTTRFSSP